jgi:uncharacterized protein YutE (UPF0331/DUF86 family)
VVDKDLTRTKLTIIASNVAILDGRESLSLEDFSASIDQQYVVLHALQLCIQAAIDIGAHIVVDERWSVPSRSGEVFEILANHNAIPKTLSENLRKMAGFRNIIVHEYAEVDLKTVYEIWHESLDDIREYSKYISKHFGLE